MQTLEELLKLWEETAMTELEVNDLIILLMAEKTKFAELRRFLTKGE